MASSAPAGYTTVAPWIVTSDAGRLLDFITAVFDGQELARVPLENGSIGHAFGQRDGRVRDPFGNIWWISAVVEDVASEEGMRRLSEPTYADAMRDAQETLDRELNGGDQREVSRRAIVWQPDQS